MKFIIFEPDCNTHYHILVEQRDGSYRLFASCETRAQAEALHTALNHAEQTLGSKKDKK
jgi:hypothetical protein